MKRIWIYLSLALVAILILSGVGVYFLVKNDEGPETEKAGKEITIMRRDTLRIVDTIYGEINASYVHYREGDGISSPDRYNITVRIPHPSGDIYYLGIDYRSIDIDGSVSGVGSGRMAKFENGTYYVTMLARTGIWDIWIEIYERGMKLWDELNKTYYYSAFRTEVISVVISDEYYTSDMDRNIVISDIKYGFEKDSMNRFNITFHISSQSDPRTILVNYDMDLKSDGEPAPRKIEYGSLGNGNYYATFDISDGEKDDLRFLHFSIAASNAERMRVTSPVFKVPFM